MSLWCGACRQCIYDGFGLLYKIEFNGDIPVYPNQGKDIVPANSAVCDECWNDAPSLFKDKDEKTKKLMEDNKEPFFLYVKSDSGYTSFGAKEWSSIGKNFGDQYYIPRNIAVSVFPKALEIIEGTSQAQQGQRAKERVTNHEAL